MAMVRSVNQVLLVGRIGTIYPRQKNTRDGKPGPLNISMATQETYRNDKSRSDWHKVTFWGVNADFAEKYLNVGAMVAVEGKLRTSQRRNPDGSLSTFVNVEGQQLILLIGAGGKRGGDDQAGESDGGSDYQGEEPQDSQPDDAPEDGPEINF